jgi:hypothetical protein
MNTIYLLGQNRDFTDDLCAGHFATDAEGLERIARYELSTCLLRYDHIIVDMAANVVHVRGEDGNVAHKFYIWTLTRLP